MFSNGISITGKPITKTFGEVADSNNFIGFTHPFILRETVNLIGTIVLYKS